MRLFLSIGIAAGGLLPMLGLTGCHDHDVYEDRRDRRVYREEVRHTEPRTASYREEVIVREPTVRERVIVQPRYQPEVVYPRKDYRGHYID